MQPSTQEDLAILQTAAALENTAIAAYDRVLKRDVYDESPFFKEFLGTVRGHHVEHAKAFNEAIARLGGQPQRAKHSALEKLVEVGKPDDIDELELANELLGFTVETTLSHTHTEAVATLGDPHARTLMARVAGVEAQHHGMMNLFESLIEEHAVELMAVPTKPDKLDPVTGRIGAADSFQKTSLAQPSTSGRVSG